MIKLVIFDLDGTLLNSLEDLADSCNFILRKYNFPEHPLESYRQFVGNGVSKLVERALPSDKRSKEDVANYCKEFVEYYSLHSQVKTSPYKGIMDLLLELQKKGIALAVASNKFISGTQNLVKKYFESIEFETVLGQREGIPTKPNPQIVYDIMHNYGAIDKDSILYIGDSGTDMQTAVNAGVRSVGVLWGFRDEPELLREGATFMASNPDEILKIISELR